MKSTALFSLIGLGLFVLCFAIWLGTRWYGVIEAIQGVTVLYSNDEAFVFVGNSKAVLAEKKGTLLLKHLAQMFLFPDHVSDDLLAVHFKDGKISKSDLKEIGYSGSAFVYHGQVYCYWGSELERNSTWKWSGSNFVAVSDVEKKFFIARLRMLMKQRTQKWNLKSFQAGWDKPEVTVHLQSGDVKVYADVQPLANGKNHRARIMSAQTGKTNSPETLIDVIQGYQEIEINKEEYLKLKAQTNMPSN